MCVLYVLTVLVYSAEANMVVVSINIVVVSGEENENEDAQLQDSSWMMKWTTILPKYDHICEFLKEYISYRANRYILWFDCRECKPGGFFSNPGLRV